MTGAWGLLLPVIYFATVAYPATTAHGPYSHNGLSFVRRNLHYYKSVLAPTGVLQALYLVLAILALAAAVRAARDRDYFPLAVLGAAGATLMPALLQGQQQNIYYVAMPLLLLFSSLGAGVRSALGQRPVHPRTAYVALAVATVGLVLVFVHAGDNRNAIMQSPFGRTLASFRSQVASLVPADSSICAKLDMSAPQQQGFIADMSGTDGFLVPPINAGQAQLMASGLPPCSPGDASITVRLNPRGDFVASG
jgi:hypothetical protein